VGLVHGREFLIRPTVALLLLGFVLACGGSDASREPAPADSTVDPVPPAAEAPDSAVTLLGTLPEGGPMPSADNAGGIPAYPGARVHTSREQTDEMRSFEAFTPDTWPRVVAWFDSQLGPPAWSRKVAEDMVIYQKGDDEAAITVSPWDWEHLPAGAPAFMEGARTAIGAAWRPSPGER
jgi:hypothetical protein